MGRLYKKSQSLSRGLTSDTTSAILWFYGKKERSSYRNLRNLGRFLLDRHISLIYNSRSERNGSSHTDTTDSERVRKKGKVMETTIVSLADEDTWTGIEGCHVIIFKKKGMDRLMDGDIEPADAIYEPRKDVVEVLSVSHLVEFYLQNRKVATNA